MANTTATKAKATTATTKATTAEAAKAVKAKPAINPDDCHCVPIYKTLGFPSILTLDGAHPPSDGLYDLTHVWLGVRGKKTGEVLTLYVGMIQDGRFSLDSDFGSNRANPSSMSAWLWEYSPADRGRDREIIAIIEKSAKRLAREDVLEARRLSKERSLARSQKVAEDRLAAIAAMIQQG